MALDTYPSRLVGEVMGSKTIYTQRSTEQDNSEIVVGRWSSTASPESYDVIKGSDSTEVVKFKLLRNEPGAENSIAIARLT